MNKKLDKKKVVITVIFLILVIILILYVAWKNNYTATQNIESVNLQNDEQDENVSISNNEDEEVVFETEQEIEIEERVAWEWQKDSPKNQNVDGSVLDNLHDTYESESIVLASCIVRNGVIIDEYYQEGYDETSVFSTQST